jgi:hypothetical protein
LLKNKIAKGEEIEHYCLNNQTPTKTIAPAAQTTKKDINSWEISTKEAAKGMTIMTTSTTKICIHALLSIGKFMLPDMPAITSSPLAHAGGCRPVDEKENLGNEP